LSSAPRLPRGFFILYRRHPAGSSFFKSNSISQETTMSSARSFDRSAFARENLRANPQPNHAHVAAGLPPGSSTPAPAPSQSAAV